MPNKDENMNYSLELVVKGDAIVTFDTLKKLQELGYAREDSTIVYKKVRVPAGFCTDFQNFIVTYGSIVSGDHAGVFGQVPDGLNNNDAVRFLGVCSLSLEKCGRSGLSKDDVVNYLQYRDSQKKKKNRNI